MAHTTSPKWPRHYHCHEQVLLAKRWAKVCSTEKRVSPLQRWMCEAYATSLSAFSGGHNQLSSTTPVTSSSPAPHTGIPNRSLAGTRPTFVHPPKNARGCLQTVILWRKNVMVVASYWKWKEEMVNGTYHQPQMTSSLSLPWGGPIGKMASKSMVNWKTCISTAEMNV